MKPTANGTILKLLPYPSVPTCGSAQNRAKNAKDFFKNACVIPKNGNFQVKSAGTWIQRFK